MYAFFIYFLHHYSQQRSAVRSTANINTNTNLINSGVKMFPLLKLLFVFVSTINHVHSCAYKKKIRSTLACTSSFLTFPHHYSQRKVAVRSTALIKLKNKKKTSRVVPTCSTRCFCF